MLDCNQQKKLGFSRQPTLTISRQNLPKDVTELMQVKKFLDRLPFKFLGSATLGSFEAPVPGQISRLLQSKDSQSMCDGSDQQMSIERKGQLGVTSCDRNLAKCQRKTETLGEVDARVDQVLPVASVRGLAGWRPSLLSGGHGS